MNGNGSLYKLGSINATNEFKGNLAIRNLMSSNEYFDQMVVRQERSGVTKTQRIHSLEGSRKQKGNAELIVTPENQLGDFHIFYKFSPDEYLQQTGLADYMAKYRPTEITR